MQSVVRCISFIGLLLRGGLDLTGFCSCKREWGVAGLVLFFEM